MSPKCEKEHDDKFCLVTLMSKCDDFANEVTQLQGMGTKMGVQVLTTPKYHAELASEGIGYSWGVAKSY